MLSVTCEDVEASYANKLSLPNREQNVSEERKCKITNENHLPLQDWDLKANKKL